MKIVISRFSRFNPIIPGLFGFRVHPGGLFLPAAHISRLAYTTIMKFGMEIVLNKGSWKIILKMRLLPWLHNDVITKCANGPKQYIKLMSCISRGRRLFANLFSDSEQ